MKENHYSSPSEIWQDSFPPESLTWQQISPNSAKHQIYGGFCGGANFKGAQHRKRSSACNLTGLIHSGGATMPANFNHVNPTNFPVPHPPYRHTQLILTTLTMSCKMKKYRYFYFPVIVNFGKCWQKKPNFFPNQIRPKTDRLFSEALNQDPIQTLQSAYTPKTDLQITTETRSKPCNFEQDYFSVL